MWSSQIDFFNISGQHIFSDDYEHSFKLLRSWQMFHWQLVSIFQVSGAVHVLERTLKYLKLRCHLIDHTGIKFISNFQRKCQFFNILVDGGNVCPCFDMSVLLGPALLDLRQLVPCDKSHLLRSLISLDYKFLRHFIFLFLFIFDDIQI